MRMLDTLHYLFTDRFHISETQLDFDNKSNCGNVCVFSLFLSVQMFGSMLSIDVAIWKRIYIFVLPVRQQVNIWYIPTSLCSTPYIYLETY